MFHLVSQLVNLGEPNIYHDLEVFYKEVGILFDGCLTCEELVWYSKKREDENHPPILVVPSF